MKTDPLLLFTGMKITRGALPRGSKADKVEKSILLKLFRRERECL